MSGEGSAYDALLNHVALAFGLNKSQPRASVRGAQVFGAKTHAVTSVVTSVRYAVVMTHAVTSVRYDVVMTHVVTSVRYDVVMMHVVTSVRYDVVMTRGQSEG